MAKRFKLRISRLIHSFQSCRPKHPPILPDDHVRSFLPLSSLIKTHAPPHPKPHLSSFKRHVSSALMSVGCGLTPKPAPAYASEDGLTGSPLFRWRKDERFHDAPRRDARHTSASEDDGFLPPPPPPPTAEKKKRRSKKKKKITMTRFRISTSSAESGMFSSEGGDEGEDEVETENLVSSPRSFSTDSSMEINPQLKTISETTIPKRRNKKKKKKKEENRAKREGNHDKVKPFHRTSVSSAENESPARLSMFKKLIPCTVEGKVRESFAVVKKSEDPYEDFKRSMMEMIMEKEMYEKEDLEQLLQCFLSLNSRDHHGVIVGAFSEIWKAMFGTT